MRLSPKAFDVLSLLVDQRPAVVTKADLHARIWPGIFVVDANLSVLVNEIRRALGDSPQQPQFVRTVHRIGYAFCAKATELGAGDQPATDASTAWLVWNERAFVLAAGDNIVGRDPQCDVWLDASGVSRRHARVHVAADGTSASIEDLGSTNGTFLRGGRTSGEAPLRDGDVAKLGPETVTFRAWSADTPKKTERIRGRTGRAK